MVGAHTQPLATVLCTSGLAVEAKIARAAGFSVVVGAGDRERTKALVETAAARAKCLVSFGIAGGLAPGLKAGTVVVSGDVVSERQRWSVDAQYRDRLGEFARDIGAIEGPVFGATSILATQSEKRRAWTASGALAVDLESEIVARAAETKADLIVMGTHGRSGLAHALLGSVAERVVQHAPCPVLIVPKRG